LTHRGAMAATEEVRQRWANGLRKAQARITDALADLDGTPFREDAWTRGENHGGGWSRVLQDGNVFEKAGVNVSVVRGELSPQALKAMCATGRLQGLDGRHCQFFAAGLSLVIHPKNPMAPTAHLNYRYFEVTDDEGEQARWWVGGGADLTPSYLFEEDAVDFHSALKSACDKHDDSYYGRFKQWCDEYFYIPHRKESRGVGGIFFDDLCTRPALAPAGRDDRDALMDFCLECLDTFAPTYTSIVRRRKDSPFTPVQKEWQQMRRGRYVEFNLMYDRGTKFGLNTPDNTRIESVLMSLPLTARWEYCHEVEEGSEEHKLLEVLRTPRDWMCPTSH